ncbi:hypothetical protein ANN_24917 [Periplaneta americana]|uniref:Uncharacterized protein n=1 Tax=Periplaneta americana TaxID=6978 RepID=A0ABQ8S039_PERAM|nr:hypothetical protein ANN_24917 [Periplaneta americana]
MSFNTQRFFAHIWGPRLSPCEYDTEECNSCKLQCLSPTAVITVERHILENRCITFSELEVTTGFARITLQCIVHEHLKMGKASARWVLKFLTAAHRQQRKDVSSDLLL